jgi:hypothetical protein
MSRIYLIIILLLCFGGWGRASGRLEALRDITLTEHGSESGGDFCKDFDVTATQVASFFARARVFNAQSIHDKFDQLPCYVRGTALWRGAPAKWEIRAGGTGTLIPQKGKAVQYGCVGCDDLFGQTK